MCCTAARTLSRGNSRATAERRTGLNRTVAGFREPRKIPPVPAVGRNGSAIVGLRVVPLRKLLIPLRNSRDSAIGGMLTMFSTGDDGD